MKLNETNTRNCPGLNYGITNTKGKPSMEESLQIIELCMKNDINEYDTAHAYGNSSYILGLANQKYPTMKIITKLPALKLDCGELLLKLNNYINLMLKTLKSKTIKILLLHDFSNY